MAFPNLIKALGGIDRENPEWSGELGKVVGEKGISVRRTPLYDMLPKSWTQSRPFTFGNTIFIPEEASKRYNEEYGWSNEDIVREEIPHVQQFREEGLLGFLGKHVWDLAKHGAGQKTYDALGTHESYHHADPSERSRLMGGIFND